jgi:hypothetical protein
VTDPRPDDTLPAVTAALHAIAPAGTFAVERSCSSEPLSISVEGVGALRFPISAPTARKLRAIARPAPFGRRDQTLHDRTVRDTLQIAKSRIVIDARRWNVALARELDLVRAELGLPEGKLTATVDKMLVYAPGQFFAPHQDSERSDDMIGSLVVELPCAHAGGSVVVQHHREKRVFHGARRGPTDLALLAFYADCHHEVRPIETGNRIVLTYHLTFRAAPRARTTPRAAASAVDALTASIRTYLETAVAPAYGNRTPELPDRLVYLLDHQYTEKSLGWTRLKNGDRLRVEALRAAAERLDCEHYLTLADVHENWLCDGGDDWYSRGRRGYRDRFEEEDSPEEHTLQELCDSEVELRHWVARDGKTAPSVAVAPAGDEICFTKATVELEPFKSEHEGYMGNYGNTMDRWYHRAAFVMWPRSRNFVLRAKVSPSWAVTELVRRTKTRQLDDATEGARSLLPFWRSVAPRENGATFVPRLLGLVLALGDSELAHGLLAPFAPHRLTARAVPTFAALVEQFGATWAKRLFTTWSGAGTYRTTPWLQLLPDLLERLRREGPTHGSAVANWLLDREVNTFAKARIADRSRTIWPIDEAPAVRVQDLFALVQGAARIDAAAARDRIIALVTTGGAALPILSAASLLRTCRENGTPASVRALGLGPLYEHVVHALERALAVPSRSVDDWGIDFEVHCKCHLCKTLTAFLRDSSKVELAWPLAKERRSHVHATIDGHRLPVSHVTLRRGSPYTLVLNKQTALFTGEEALRGRQKAMLAWLTKERRAFVGGQ